MDYISIVDKVWNHEKLRRDELEALLRWLYSEQGAAEFGRDVEGRWAVFADDRGFGYEQLLEKVNARIDMLETRPAQPKRVGRHRLVRYVAEAAAVIIFAFGLSVLIPGRDKSITDTPEMVEVENPRGLRTTVTLPDGSEVTLNADSRIRYSREFAGDTRTVRLDGEAFFDVTRNGKPFVVEASSAKVTVLGTSFNIRAYENEKLLTASLVEGSLKVDAGDCESILEPGKQVVLDKGSGRSSIEDMQAGRATGWMDGKLYFASMPFSEIANTLSRAFNVNISIGNPSLAEKTLTGRFENGENLEQILAVMRLSVAFRDRFDPENNTIIIY